MESYQSKHKGQTIDNVVDKVLQNEAGLQGVKVDNVELAPDIENKVNIDLNSKLENYATFSDVPTKTSQLTNDSDFATTSSLPTTTSQLTNDSGFITADELPAIPTVVQAKGSSTTDVISQNVVTQELKSLEKRIDSKIINSTETNFTNWVLTPLSKNLASYQVIAYNNSTYNFYGKIALEFDPHTRNLILRWVYTTYNDSEEKQITYTYTNIKNISDKPEFLACSNGSKFVIIDRKDGKVYRGSVGAFGDPNSGISHVSTLGDDVYAYSDDRYTALYVNNLLYVMCNYASVGFRYLYASSDFGSTWTRIDDMRWSTFYFIRYINGAYYLGRSNSWSNPISAIYKSTDGKTNFTLVNTQNFFIEDIAYDSSRNRWYAIGKNKFYYGTNLSQLSEMTYMKMSGNTLCKFSKDTNSGVIGLIDYYSKNKTVYVTKDFMMSEDSYQSFYTSDDGGFYSYYPTSASTVNYNIVSILKIKDNYYIGELKDYTGTPNTQNKIPSEYLTKAIPTKTSELINNSNFVTTSQMNTSINAVSDNSKNIICNSNLLNFTNWNLHPINDRPASMQVVAYDKVGTYANRNKIFLTFDTETKAVKINTLYNQTLDNYLCSNTMYNFPKNESYDPEFWLYTDNDKYIIIHGTDGKVYSGNTGVNGISNSPTQIGTYPETTSYPIRIKRYRLVCVNGLLYVYCTYGTSDNNTLYVSNDYGVTWQNTGLNYMNISFLRYINGAYYLREGYYQRLYTSTDGITFTNISASNTNISDVAYDSVNNKWYGLYNQELYSGTSIGNMTKISGSKMSGTILARYSKTNPLAVIGLWGEEEYSREYNTIYSTDNFVNIKDSYQAFKQLGVNGFGMYHPFEVSETNASILALVKLYSKYYIAELRNYSENLTPPINIPPEMCLPTVPTTGTYSLKVVNGKIQWVSG